MLDRRGDVLFLPAQPPVLEPRRAQRRRQHVGIGDRLLHDADAIHQPAEWLVQVGDPAQRRVLQRRPRLGEAPHDLREAVPQEVGRVNPAVERVDQFQIHARRLAADPVHQRLAVMPVAVNEVAPERPCQPLTGAGRRQLRQRLGHLHRGAGVAVTGGLKIPRRVLRRERVDDRPRDAVDRIVVSHARGVRDDPPLRRVALVHLTDARVPLQGIPCCLDLLPVRHRRRKFASQTLLVLQHLALLRCCVGRDGYLFRVGYIAQRFQHRVEITDRLLTFPPPLGLADRVGVAHHGIAQGAGCVGTGAAHTFALQPQPCRHVVGDVLSQDFVHPLLGLVDRLLGRPALT